MKQLRECPYSGQIFKPKRSNQKFALKKNRVNFYNQQYREKRLPLERINQRLFLNYSILEQELHKNTKTIDRMLRNGRIEGYMPHASSRVLIYEDSLIEENLKSHLPIFQNAF